MFVGVVAVAVREAAATAGAEASGAALVGGDKNALCCSLCCYFLKVTIEAI